MPVIGVITPTLHTDMLVLALFTEAAAERAIEPRATASAGVGETHDLLPLLLWNSQIAVHRLLLDELGRSRLGGFGLITIAITISTSLLEQGLVLLSTSAVLPGASFTLWRCRGRRARTRSLEAQLLNEHHSRAACGSWNFFEGLRESREVLVLVIVELVDLLP